MINTYIDTKQIYLSSSSSNSNTSSVVLLNGNMKSHINYIIPKLVTQGQNILYNTIKISHIEMPYSFYIINEYNNKLKISNTIINTIIEIPFGNYNANSFMEKINLLFIQYGLIDFILTFNTTNGKYTLSSDTYFTIYSAETTIQKLLGLDNYDYNSIFDFSNNNYTLEFPYLADTSGIKNIFVKSNIITGNLNTYNNDSNVLKSIPVNVPPYGILNYNNSENIETLIRNRWIDNLVIQLTDDFNNLINFNNIDWSICLEIKTTYQMTINNIKTIDDYFLNSITE